MSAVESERSQTIVVAHAEGAQVVDRLGVGVVDHEVQSMRRALADGDFERIPVFVTHKAGGIADATELREVLK